MGIENLADQIERVSATAGPIPIFSMVWFCRRPNPFCLVGATFVTNEANHKGQLFPISHSWLIFGLLLLMSFFVTLFGRWVVFEVVITPLVVSIAVLWGVFSLDNHVKHYPRTPQILAAVPLALLLLFACCFLTFFFAFPPTKTCSLESLTVARCEDHYERFGNSVPEPAPCSWNQTHILGLILIEKETDKLCGSGP